MEVDEPIHLEPYDAAWASWFAVDAEELKATLGQRLQALEHFGSTAVPGMLAKPVVDLLLAPTQWPPSADFLRALQALGYEHLGQAGVPGREYLRRRARHDTNLAVVCWQGTHWRNNLAIRDFLRASPHVAARYGAVKRQAWEGGATTLLAYSQAKSSFMAELSSAALGRASSPLVVDIRQEPWAMLPEYARIPSVHEVSEVLAAVTPEGGLGGIQLVLSKVAAPYVKDYDAVAGHRPDQWCARFDLKQWGLLSAWSGDDRVGGAVVAWNSPELGACDDVAVLWDLRVAPSARRRGVATGLFRAAEAWATGKGARRLQIETQNSNVPACRFYLSQGCSLGALHRFAYASLPEEVQLLWYKQLGGEPHG